MDSLYQVPFMLRRVSTRSGLLGAIVLSLACSARGPVSMDAAQQVSAVTSANDAGGFVAVLGSDTVSVERFTRTATTLEGDIVVRAPSTRVIHYSATLGPDGTIQSYESALRPGSALQGPPTQQASVVLFGDSARITTSGGPNNAPPTTTTIAARRGAVPTSVVVYSLLEQGALQHRRGGQDSSQVDVIVVGGRQVIPVSYVDRGTDSLLVYFRAVPIHVSVDRNGRFTGLDGSRTTDKVFVQRVASVDFDRIAAGFASRDQAGQALGQLSPRDTVVAAVGGANISINYSRPARRGRAIWGNVVPWNQVWRTGANAATSLTTSADITIGGVAVPAGSYTLYSLPAETGTKLIINSQTGQWGTGYDPAKDLGRADLSSETLATPVEQFTIEIVPAGSSAQLQLSWDRTRFSVPITAKQ